MRNTTHSAGNWLLVLVIAVFPLQFAIAGVSTSFSPIAHSWPTLSAPLQVYTYADPNSPEGESGENQKVSENFIDGRGLMQTFTVPAASGGFSLDHIVITGLGPGSPTNTYTLHLFDLNTASIGPDSSVYIPANDTLPPGADLFSDCSFIYSGEVNDQFVKFTFSGNDAVRLESNHLYAFEIWGPNEPNAGFYWLRSIHNPYPGGRGYYCMGSTDEGRGPGPSNLYNSRSQITGNSRDMVMGVYGAYTSYIYVDANATGAHNGTSWANAYKYLQDALAAAEPNYEIWVAKGTYRPDRDTSHPGGTGSRTTTFQLKNGVALYGGFPTGGGLWASRDPNIHQTILSGDIGVLTDANDNSYNVVTGSGTDSSAILDGFTVTGGNANSSGVWPYNFGGGMFATNTDCIVSNCTFFENAAELGGGGILFNQSNHPVVANCSFISNKAFGAGNNAGGLYNIQSNTEMINCSFINNSAQYGGGVSNINSSSPIITNCIFSGNSATGLSGGMNNWNGGNQTLTNCTFSGNSAQYGDEGGLGSGNDCYVTLTDCSFSGNSAQTGGDIGTYNTGVIYFGGSSRIQGIGGVKIGFGGKMIIDSSAVVDLNDPNDPNIKGTIQCDGLLKVKDNAQLKHATVNISRQTGGVYGKFAVEGAAQVTNLDIYADGDRYMDVDPCTFMGIIANNRIYVTITEGQNETPEGILEVRGGDLPSHPCDFNNPNTLACRIDDVNMPAFDTNSWTLERLTVAPGAKVTLMDRFSSGNGSPEVLCVKDLNLGAGCVLNVGSRHFYYTICSGDMNSIRKKAQLGFSLGVINADSDEEFQSQVGSNNYINSADPNSSRVYVKRVVGFEPDPNGMMKMQSLEDPCTGQMISARAKGEFAPATEEEIRIRFNYLFNDPCGQIVVYLSDVPELLDPCDPNRDTHYIEVGRVFAPPAPMPGSVGSNRFGNFDKFVSTSTSKGELDLSKGTWIELELIEPGQSGPLLARGSAEKMQIMESQEEETDTGGLVHGLSAGVSCSSTCGFWDVCRDLDDNCAIDAADLLIVVSGIGTTDPPSCVDGTLSADGYTDSYDIVSWDWMLEQSNSDLCGEVPPKFSGGGSSVSSGGFGAFGGNMQLLDLADFNDLLIEGKRGDTSSDVKLQDRLYIFNSDPCYVEPIELAPDDRCNIRIVRGTGDDLYKINSEKGLLHLKTGIPIISPGQITCEFNEPRYDLHATVYAGIQAGGSPYGRPILDAAFDTAGFVYVVPVVVVPITNEPNTYTAAAKIQLNPPNPPRVVKLYDGPLLAYDYAHPEYQLQYRNNLREIELDDACNVYVTNANAHNESDILWKFEPNGTVVRLNLDLSNPPVRAPTGLCVSSATNTIYLASSIRNDTNPNSVIICGFSTTTLSPTPARTITVRKMQRITSIAEDPVTGTLWVAGLSFNGGEIDQYAPFYDPNLAKVPLKENDVNAVCTLGANDLAMPLSICWTGARLPPELCGGADLNKNGTVNMADFAWFAGYWRHTDCTSQNNYCNGADLEPQAFPDGDVDLMDLAVFAEHWLDTGCQ